MTWFPPTILPVMFDECRHRESKPVLVIDDWGNAHVMRLEQHLWDEEPSWYTECGDHWRYDLDKIRCWQPIDLS